MSYPNIRCMHFDDDGKATGRGCYKGNDCTFTHPNDPRWPQASRSRKVGGGGGRASSGSFSNSQPRRMDSGWPRDKPFSNSSADKGAEKDTATNSGWGKLPELGSSSGLAASWGAIISKESSTTNNSAGGWGPSESGWASGAASGWGTSPDKDTSNATAPAWGGGGSGWGETGSADAWNASKGKEKKKEDVIMADSTPTQTGWGAPPPPPAPRADNNDNSNHARRKELPQLQTDTRSPYPSLASPISITTPSSSKVPAPASASSSSRRMSSALLSAGNLQKAALELSATKAAKLPAGRASGADSPAMTNTKQYVGSKGRVNLFQDILSKMFDLTVSEVLYRYALSDDERWKRTQVSHAYERASLAGRQKLDEIMTQQRKKLYDASRTRDANLKALLKLPGFATEFKALHPEVIKEKVKHYVDEIRLWVKDLHKLMTTETDRQTEEKGNEEPNSRSGLQKLINDINLMEERLDGINTSLFEQVYINREINVTLDPLPNEEDEDSGALLDKIALLRSDADEVGETLKREADQITALTLEFHQIQEHINSVAQENERMFRTCEWAEQQLDQLYTEQQADESDINELAETVRKLEMEIGKPPGGPSTPSLNPPVTSITIDELYEHIRPVVLKQITDEALPILDAIRKRSDDNRVKVEDQIVALIKKINERAEAVIKRVTPLTQTHLPQRDQ